ncbi:hypothetical protein PO124_32390 [Bacillus licheniformis]|nr:hypothetical protein [Bacillus licheniformis]
MHRAATGAPLAPLSIEKEGMTIVLHGTSRQMKEGTSKSAVSMFYHWQKDTEHLFMYTMSR